MKTILASALAFGAMTSVALAMEPANVPNAPTGPVELTDVQMDSITAGQVTQEGLVNVGAHLEERAVNIPIDIEVRDIRVAVIALGRGPIRQP